MSLNNISNTNIMGVPYTVLSSGIIPFTQQILQWSDPNITASTKIFGSFINNTPNNGQMNTPNFVIDTTGKTFTLTWSSLNGWQGVSIAYWIPVY